MLTMEKLRDFGANAAEGLGRCMNNEAFYFRMIGLSIADSGFETLRQAVDAGDLDRAFEAAHALKGVLGNLSLTPLYQPASELTELLRAKTEADYAAYVTELLAQRDKLKALCE